MSEIPSDWKLLPLGEAVDFLDGQRKPVKDADRAKMRGDIPYYGASGIVDYVNTHLFDEDLILLGEDGENILSRNCRLAFKISGKSWVNNHAHVIRPKESVSLDYLVEYLESLNYEQYNTGTAQPKLNKLVCSGIPVLLPPEYEQRAIASALSDVDALIAGLEKLIAKKRDLKQAAMQQLLTGQTRLPGFSGEWTVKRLGEVGECLRGVSYKGDSDLFAHDTDRSKRLLRSNNVQESLVVTSDLQYVKVDRVREHQILREGDVLICMANGSKALVGKAAYFEINDGFEYTFGAFMGAYRGNEQANRRFVFYLFQTGRYRDYITNLLAGSSINNLSPSSIESLEFNFPELAEQEAISQALSDMDGELVSFQSRLAKTRELKQGMMQELLTGKTRLI